MSEQMNNSGPRTVEMVEGETFHVAGRELTPIARVTKRVQRRAFLGDDRLSGSGWGFMRMQPVAILERDETGERRIPIQDQTTLVLGRLLLVAVIVPVVAMIAIGLTRLYQKQKEDINGS